MPSPVVWNNENLLDLILDPIYNPKLIAPKGKHVNIYFSGETLNFRARSKTFGSAGAGCGESFRHSIRNL
jgi:hypothetical protein